VKYKLILCMFVIFSLLSGQSVLFAQDSVDVTFYYNPPGANPNFVSVPGEFNNWNINTDLMTYDSDQGHWYLTKRLRLGGPDPLPNPGKSIPGAYQYKFNLNGSTWISDPLNPRRNSRDNNNSYLFINNPTIHYLLPNSLSELVNTSRPQISAYIFPSTSSQVDTASIKVTIDEQVYENVGTGYNSESHLFKFTPSKSLTSGQHTLRLYAESSTGSQSEDSTVFTIFTEEDAFIVFLTRSNPRQLRSSISIDGTTADPNLPVTLIYSGVDSFEIMSDANGFFSKQVDLIEGENNFQAFAKDSADTTRETEILTLHYFVDHAPRPTINSSTDQKVVFLSSKGNDPDDDVVSFLWTSDDDINPEPINVSSDQATILVPLPGTPGEYYLDLQATDPDTNTGFSRTFFTINEDGSCTVSSIASNSGWVQNALIYEIFLPSFTKEGTLAAAEGRLEFVKSIGVNTIWLMPIYENGESINELNAGYNTTDFYKVHPQLGTLNDLKSFLTKAHSLGMRVILDSTPNHSSGEHHFSKDVALFEDYSIYRPIYETKLLGDSRGLGQFERKIDNYTWYVHYSNWSLPNFNFSNIETWDYMINVFKYWVLDVGVDGYRLDVYWGPNNRYGKEVWWRPFREEMSRTRPEALLLGETDGTGFDSENNYADGGGALDAAYDWSFYGEIKSALNGGSISALDDRVRNYSPNLRYNFHTGINAHYFRFLENHDETRIAEMYSIEKTKVGAAVLYTIPGLPMIYAGQEVGETSRRGLINWGRENGQEVTAYYKQLGKIRNIFPAFSSDLIHLEESGNLRVYSYVRPYLDENALVVNNFSGSEQTASISITDEDLFLSDTLESGKTYYLNDVLNNSVIPVTKSDLQTFKPMIPAWTTAVYILADSIHGIIDDIENLVTADAIPKEFDLKQNYPNPFNPVTTISYSLPKAAAVSLQIYDVVGRMVYDNNLKDKLPGEYKVTWNGTNQQGNKVGSGVYFYRIVARGMDQESWSASRKMILLR